MGRNNKVSTVLTFLGALGVIGTTLTAVKATPKAIKMLEKAEEEKNEALTKAEMVRVAGPAYIPSIVIGLSTIACIFGANILNKRQQAALTSAYALLENSYREYKSKVNELYGEDSNEKIQAEIAKETYEEYKDEYVTPEGEQLFMDFSTLQYFTAKMEDVLQKVEMEDGLECYIISTPFDCFENRVNYMGYYGKESDIL